MTPTPRRMTTPDYGFEDVKRPGDEIIEALRKEKIYIGRVWKTWPTYVRVSIGTQEEMNKFKTAFLKVMA